MWLCNSEVNKVKVRRVEHMVKADTGYIWHWMMEMEEPRDDTQTCTGSQDAGGATIQKRKDALGTLQEADKRRRRRWWRRHLKYFIDNWCQTVNTQLYQNLVLLMSQLLFGVNDPVKTKLQPQYGCYTLPPRDQITLVFKLHCQEKR